MLHPVSYYLEHKYLNKSSVNKGLQGFGEECAKEVLKDIKQLSVKELDKQENPNMLIK